jgi:PAS domain S-box-containing protein
VRDVTESRKVERRLRRLIDSNVQGVIFWNNTGRITSANDAFLRTVGYDREDLERGSINWLGMTPPEHEEADRRALLELAARGVASAYEKEYFRKDGSRVPVLVGVATFEDTVNEGVCFVVDLTERKKLELQFLRAQRMESVGTLASGVAHDLNNVLAPILMSLELLKEGTRSEDDLELLATLHTSARRGADLVKQLLAFARGVAGERVQVDPRAVMNDLLAVMRETFPKSIDVRFSPPSTLWPIIGDATQLYQVLLNLCVNARDAMPKGGSLTVKMANVVLDATYAAMNRDARPGAYVRMQVADTGTGIAPEVREKIFEPFFTTKGVGKGTGLGLSTTLGIIKSHGGFVHVYSEPGRGTQFEVYLPAAASVAAEPAPKAVTASLLPRGNGELILVVDDEAAIRRIVQQLLEKYGYRVLVATQGAEGLAIYTQRQQEIAAVLTDMAMPIMDGAALIIALREMNPGVRIIASSGLSTNQEISKATGTGARAFLPKPYTAEAILGTLHALLHD